MKKRNILLILLLMLIGMTTNVKADGFNYYLSNKDNNYEIVDKKTVSIRRGSDIYVTSVIDNTSNINTYQLGKGKLTIRWDESVLELVKVDDKYYDASDNDFSSITYNNVDKTNNKLVIHEFASEEIVKSGKNKLVTFKFHVLDNAKFGETKIYEMDGEDSINCFDTNEERTITCAESMYSELKFNIEKSNVNTLSNIKINGNLLDNFNENNNQYELTVDSNMTSIKIEATKKDETSTIKGDTGNKNIVYGMNTFKIIVTSESGKENTYVLNIERPDNRSDINTLKTLTVDPVEITFDPNTMEYTINVTNEVDKIVIDSTLTDLKAKYVPGFGNREENLIEGSNKFLIKVVSEREEERVYTLNINRALSSNNSLKSLRVNDEKIILNENEFIYNLEFDNTIEEAVIKAVPNDPKAVLDVKDKYLLEVGENEILIGVTAPDGSKALYTVNITRKKKLSNNSKLVNLKIKDYELDFSPDVTLYNLKIEDKTEELEIYTTLSDETATVNIEGNKNLVNGSIIKVNVKAEDGTYTRYFINIEKNTKNGILPIIITIIILLILLITCVTILIIRKKKEKENKEFKEFDNEQNEVNSQEIVSNVEEQINVNPDNNTLGNDVSYEENPTEQNDVNENNNQVLNDNKSTEEENKDIVQN